MRRKLLIFCAVRLNVAFRGAPRVAILNRARWKDPRRLPAHLSLLQRQIL